MNEHVAERYPALQHLAQAYLHQDHDLEYGVPMDAVDDFLSGEPGYSSHVVAEVQRALDEFPTEEESRRFVLDVLDSSYEPDEDGTTYRDWLRSVADRARAAGL